MAKQANKIRADQRRVVTELNKFTTIMGREAVKHFRKSFRNQGFTDQSLSKWQPRKRTERSRQGSRAILVKKGAAGLLGSIKIKSKSMRSVTIGSDLPYAQIHNDGLMGKAWGKHPFRMPKRQYAGFSRQMNRKILMMLDKRIKRIFN